MPNTDPAQPSIDRLLDQLSEAHDADVDALVASYRAGTLTLTQLVSQAHDAIQQNADDDLDAITPEKHGGHQVLLYGLLFGTLGGLAMLSKPDQASAIGETSSMFALQAAAAEYGGDVKPAVIAEVRRNLEERLQAVADSLSAGEITGPQAAAYVETILRNDSWLTFGTEQNSQAKDAGETHAWWETGDSKETCSDCQEREDNSPYELDDLPGIPGDLSTECQQGCVCSVRYGKAEKAALVLVKVARCPDCHRKLGENVNRGARIHCGRCREVVEVA